MYYLYEIKFPDSKFYVGVTKNLNLRFNQHSRSRLLVGRRIRKENSKKEEVFFIRHSSESLDDVLELEEFIVDQETLDDPRCLNMAEGGAKGGCFKGHSHSESAKKRISEKLKGRVISEEHRKKIGDSSRGRYVGIKFSDERKEKISKASKAMWAKEGFKEKYFTNNPRKSHSEETKMKISKAHMKGGAHHNAKKVVQSNKDGSIVKVHDSIALASKDTGFSVDRIGKAMKGLSNTTGFIWRPE